MDETTKRVLIVDDNAGNLSVVAGLVSKMGYEIILAQNGKEGLKSAKKYSPDAVLLDIMMPDMDGYEVCSELRSLPQTKDIPIIFLTAKLQEDGIDKAFECGGTDYVTKPYSSNVLLARLKTHIDNFVLGKQTLELKDKLKVQNQFLESIYEDVQVGLFVLEVEENSKLRYLGVNTKFEDIMGIRSKDLMYKTLEELTKHFSKFTIEELLKNAEKCISERKKISFKGRVITNEKTVLCITTLSPVVNESGAIIRIIGSSTDITELERAKHELENHKNNLEKEVKERTSELNKSREDLLLAQQIARIGHWHFELHNDNFTCSKIVDKILGMPISQGVPISKFRKLIDPSYIDRFDKVLNKIFTGYREGKKIELRFISAEKYKYIEMNIKPVFNGNRCEYIFGTIQDITSRKHMEIALTKIQFAVDESSDEIYFLDKQGRFIYANQTALRNFGIPADKLGSKDIFEFNPEKTRQWWKETWETLKKDKKISLQTTHRTKDGLEYPVDIRGQYLKLEEQELCCIFCRDISRIKQYEQELVKARDAANKASEAKSQFLANMSHEIRTPMNSIIGYSQMLKKSDNLTNEQKKQIEIVDSSSHHLLNLINDILEMSKMDAGKVTLSPTNFDFINLLNITKSIFTLKAENKSIFLEYDIPSDFPRVVYADDGKIRQVIINLLGNAVKFTDRGGVRVRARHEQLDENILKITVEVEDTGYGISEDEKEKVFSYFDQTESGTKSGGSGLGLAISKGYARQMGGDITFTSQKGRGSTFSFTFTAELPEGNQQNQQLSKRTIKNLTEEHEGKLVIITDDNRDNREVLAAILNNTGFQVISAESGGETLDLLERFQPDILLLDNMMPNMTGAEVIEKIKKNQNIKDFPIIIISGDVMEKSHQLAEEAGATDFVSKPYEIDQLLEKIALYTNSEYVYEEPDADEQNLSFKDMAKYLSGIESSLFNSLKADLENGRMKEFTEQTEKLKKKDKAAGAKLYRLAESYEYEQLYKLFGIDLDDENR
ncbi:Aerobic respiration control sensor protein ArcB [Sedimentisphaera cyanobacteriorum]|uniref:Sensory/regulatory protein RpfC n=1 Tax=Sedimentisphaera cyanobacteriorum TaxID=1940790 RepID=A0A1Q2HQG9_9BACT|nr:response regulator [Sedimentisphaera cyanobacteriorum]AQQ09493.1 Aerobic respiration control sensor protein ArcB [Sedimentisphaera cyanobacteriorum]